MSSTRMDDLLDELVDHGYVPRERTSSSGLDEAILANTEYGHSFVLSASEGWVRASQMLFEAEVLQSSVHGIKVLELAMRLHARFLGCRFGFDDDDNLAVQYDIYPDMTAAHVAFALGQLCYVSSSAHPLFAATLKGELVDDARIDLAFGEIEEKN